MPLHDIPPQEKAKNLRITQLEIMLCEAEQKNKRLEAALEYDSTQRAHEYAVATGCAPEQAFDYVDRLEKEAKRREIERNKSKERIDQGVTWMCPNPGARPDTLARMAEVLLEGQQKVIEWCQGNIDMQTQVTPFCIDVRARLERSLAECVKIAEESNG